MAKSLQAVLSMHILNERAYLRMAQRPRLYSRHLLENPLPTFHYFSLRDNLHEVGGGHTQLCFLLEVRTHSWASARVHVDAQLFLYCIVLYCIVLYCMQPKSSFSCLQLSVPQIKLLSSGSFFWTVSSSRWVHSSSLVLNHTFLFIYIVS